MFENRAAAAGWTGPCAAEICSKTGMSLAAFVFSGCREREGCRSCCRLCRTLQLNTGLHQDPAGESGVGDKDGGGDPIKLVNPYQLSGREQTRKKEREKNRPPVYAHTTRGARGERDLMAMAQLTPRPSAGRQPRSQYKANVVSCSATTAADSCSSGHRYFLCTCR